MVSRSSEFPRGMTTTFPIQFLFTIKLPKSLVPLCFLSGKVVNGCRSEWKLSLQMLQVYSWIVCDFTFFNSLGEVASCKSFITVLLENSVLTDAGVWLASLSGIRRPQEWGTDLVEKYECFLGNR